jgi:hypothetical protein
VRTITTEPARTTVQGRPAAVNVPVIPADASPQLREGLRRRRVAALRGRCPCGARRLVSVFPLARSPEMNQLSYVAGGGPAVSMPFQHRPECPGHDDQLGAAIDAWQAAGGGRDGAQAG